MKHYTRVISFVGKLVVVVGVIGYQVLVHSAFKEHQNSALRFILLMIPLVLIGAWLVASVKNKIVCFLALIGLAAVLYIVDRKDDIGLAAVYGLPHAATYLGLLLFFGRTLRNGQTPLITRLATKVHGTLSEEMTAYTRRITAIWCVFFAGQIVISVLLYCFASLDQWSLFVNILNFPLLIAMFVGDYLYRIIRFRNHPQASISKAIQAFTQHTSFFKDTDKS